MVTNHPEGGFHNPGPDAVKAVNARTMLRATRFIVCPKDSFPGDDRLAEWAARKESY